MSLTPPENELDPLSEFTSCQCLQGGKDLGKSMVWVYNREERELCMWVVVLRFYKHLAKLSCHTSY